MVKTKKTRKESTLLKDFGRGIPSNTSKKGAITIYKECLQPYSKNWYAYPFEWWNWLSWTTEKKESPVLSQKKAKGISPQPGSGSESPTFQRPKGRQRAETETANPVHRNKKLGLKHQLAAASTGELGLGNFTAGRDETLRSLAKFKESTDNVLLQQEFQVPIFPFDPVVNLENQDGVLVINRPGKLHQQEYNGLGVNNYVEFQLSRLCRVRVFPENPEIPLVLFSGHFDPETSKFHMRIRGCGKVKILPPETQK
jgi:hypothetical protein